MASVSGLEAGLSLMPWGTPSFNNHTVDAATDGVGWAMQAREAVAITHIGFRYGARTGTPPTFVATLEGVSVTTGFPDGTDVGGGSPTAATFTPPADATWDGMWRWVALTNSYTPTRGQLLAPTIRYSSGTIDASNLSTFTTHLTSFYSGNNTFFPMPMRLTGGTWAMQRLAPCVALRTASSRYGWPVESFYNTRSASTVGHRHAMKFTLPAGSGDTFKIRGVRFAASIAAAAGKNPILGLWDATTAIQTLTLDADWGAFVSTSYNTQEFYFDEASLTALSFGTAYYLGLEVADAVSGGVLLNGLQLDAANDLDAYAGGSNFHFSTWNGSAWSDDTTVRPMLTPIFDDITEPAGGSGVIVAGSMRGGFVN